MKTQYSFAYVISYVIVAAAIFYQPFTQIYNQRDFFFSRGFMKHFSNYEKAYYGSQYMKKENANAMPDETFESFVGGAFLKGTNPILIVHEHPPMGRYIIALSIVLFDNPRTIIVPLLLLSFFGIFLINKLVLKNTLLALLPFLIYVNEPLIINKFYYAPLLEPIQLPFIIFSLYFFIKGIQSKTSLNYWFALTSVMLGFVISIRFFVLGAFILLAMLLYFFLARDFGKKFIAFLATLPLSLIVLFLSYTRTIQDGYSIFQIFGVQKYILFYHKSKFVNPFSFFDLFLFNRWHTWWADRAIISDPHWIIAWPIAAGLTVAFVIFVLLKKIQVTEAEKILLLWIFVYCALLSVGTATTRYFLPLLPFFYLFAILFLIRLFKFLK